METGITDKNDQPIKIGTKVRFVPDRSDKGFMNSNLGKMVDKYDLSEIHFEFIENIYGFLGFSYIVTAVKQNGELLTDGDYFPEITEVNEDDTEEFIRESERLAAKLWSETLTDYQFLNYVSKKNRFEIL